MTYDLAGKRIWVAGHRGLVGSALLRRLDREGSTLLTTERKTVDLTDRKAVESWIIENRPQAIFVAAAKVGGILANSRQPADFIYQNLSIELNLIHAAFQFHVEKLLFWGRPAYIRGQPPSQYARKRFLAVRWSLRMKPMRSRK